MSDEQMDCPKCAGTGKVLRKTWLAGKAQHIFDVGWKASTERGPFGWPLYACHRCKIERTYNGKRVVYKVDGEWVTGVGCIPRRP